MSLDKFGRRLDSVKRNNAAHPYRKPFATPMPTLSRTQDGHIDMENLKISNLKYPTEKEDAATKEYVDTKINFLKSHIDSSLEADVKKKLKTVNDIHVKIGTVKSKQELLELDIKNKLLPKIKALEGQHKLFNTNSNYISIDDKRIVGASNAINDNDLVPKGQLMEIINEKLKDFKKDFGAKI